MKRQFVSTDIIENEENLKNTFGNSSDVVYRHFIIPGLNRYKALLYLY